MACCVRAPHGGSLGTTHGGTVGHLKGGRFVVFSQRKGSAVRQGSTLPRATMYLLGGNLMTPRHRPGSRPRPAFSSTQRALAPSLLSVSIAAALGSVGSFTYVPKAHAQEAVPN